MGLKEKDIRWEQRFSNYRKALEKLKKAVDIIKPQFENNIEELSDLDELQREGLIQRFEYTHELSWKVMQDYAKYQGYQDIKGSRDSIRLGLSIGLIDSEKWMDSIPDRNRTTHTYNEQTATEIVDEILYVYIDLFIDFEKKMLQIENSNL